MSYTANYRLASLKAIEVLEEFEVSQAPIKLEKIINALYNEIQVKTYSAFMETKGFSLQDVEELFHSELGACCYNPGTNQYLIIYNDVTCNFQTCRFTIAHELGHIFLGHHQKAGTDILSPNFISQDDYKEYEKEANVFARNLLSPAPLAWAIMSNSDSQNRDIETAFDITGPAANVRINYVRRDLRDYDAHMNSYVKKIHVPFHKYCLDCGSAVPSKASYCIRCGSHHLWKGNEYTPLPPNIPKTKLRRFEKCPHCGNIDNSPTAFFCIICGAPLMNIW